MKPHAKYDTASLAYQESQLEDVTHGTRRKVGRVVAKSVGQMPFAPLPPCHKTQTIRTAVRLSIKAIQTVHIVDRRMTARCDTPYIYIFIMKS